MNLAVAEVERVWREAADPRSAQLVFCDLSTPSGKHGFNVYDDLRDKLVRKGIPEGEIAFIQDFDSDSVDLPFEYSQRLAELVLRQQELVLTLDLNRSTASEQG